MNKLVRQVVFIEDIIAMFRMKMRQYFNFQRFYAFFPIFRRTLWIGTLKMVTKERLCSPVC